MVHESKPGMLKWIRNLDCRLLQDVWIEKHQGNLTARTYLEVKVQVLKSSTARVVVRELLAFAICLAQINLLNPYMTEHYGPLM